MAKKQMRCGGRFGFYCSDLSDEDLNNSKPLLDFNHAGPHIGEFIRKNPDEAKFIEKDTHRTILHRVVRLMAERRKYTGPLPAEYQQLLNELIAAYPEALQKTDIDGKYAADYTHFRIPGPCGYSEKPTYYLGEKFATELFNYLIGKGCKHNLQSVKDQNAKPSVKSLGYGCFFGEADLAINAMMIEQYEKALKK